MSSNVDLFLIKCFVSISKIEKKRERDDVHEMLPCGKFNLMFISEIFLRYKSFHLANLDKFIFCQKSTLRLRLKRSFLDSPLI